MSVRVYWGCRTFHCERGFYGTEEDMPRDWTACPACGGDLAEITRRTLDSRAGLCRVLPAWSRLAMIHTEGGSWRVLRWPDLLGYPGRREALTPA